MSIASASLETPPVRPRAWIGAAFLAVLLAVIYAPAFATLWRTWLHNQNYSHGLLIPFVVLALLWGRRAALRAEPARPSAWGLPLLALGLAVYLAGMRGDLTMVEGDSLILVLLGLVLHFFGRGTARRTLFPIAYLVFMSPFPPVFADELSFRLKEWVITFSLRLIGALGIPVAREGMTLHLVTGTLSIENPCSGLRSLIAILALATLMAGLSRGGAVKRTVLVLSAIPVALAANWVRISIIVLASNYGGIAFGTGLVHDVSGYLLFALDVAGLFAMKGLLRC